MFLLPGTDFVLLQPQGMNTIQAPQVWELFQGPVNSGTVTPAVVDTVRSDCVALAQSAIGSALCHCLQLPASASWLFAAHSSCGMMC